MIAAIRRKKEEKKEEGGRIAGDDKHSCALFGAGHGPQ